MSEIAVFHALAALEQIDRSHPTARKLLIAPDVNWGRDILLTLARHTGGWIGWDVVTLRSLAGELAFVDLDRNHLRIGNDVELVMIADRALDEAVAAGAVSRQFAALAGGLGFRSAVRDALLEMRTAGLSPERLAEVAAPRTPAHDLAAVAERYEAALATAGIADPAQVFAVALAAFERESPFVIGRDRSASLLAIAPDLRAAGLPGELLRRLIAAGARVLRGDPVTGIETPDRSAEALAAAAGAEPWPLAELNDGDVALDLASAATPTMEVRQALRRVLTEGRRWDEVELVTTDPDTYGIALDAICGQLGIGYSALHGLPLTRTRLGRALDRWLAWIGDGLPADALREALEAGDLGGPRDGAAPTALARMLRSLEVGWGRDRYVAAISMLRDAGFAEAAYRAEDDDDEAWMKRVTGRRQTAAVLAALLDRLLAIVPEVPERGSDRPVFISLSALAAATLEYLDLVPLHGAEGEPQTLARLRTRLGALRGMSSEPVRFSMALAQLRDSLSDLRAWTALSDDRKPWSPAGGRLHLTDLAHGGLAGRPRTFVLGLDADRVGGAATQDPLLNDGVRRALESDGLPTTTVRRQERAWRTARGLARLRGTVTLSYAVAAEDGERSTGPAHVMLQALRRVQDDASLTYDDLRTALGAPACAVPDAGVASLDARDVWLGAIGAEPLLLDGVRAVREGWPALAGALGASERREGPRLCDYHGVVAAAAGRLDPRVTGRPISATSLELFGRCPLAWFYRHGLRIRPPSDPEYDPERWLDPMKRGSLLHALYERVGREFYGRQSDLVGAAAPTRVVAIAEDLIAEYRAEVPPPSESVFESEAREIRESALAFLTAECEAVREGGSRWHSFELDLDADGPTPVELTDGRTVRVTGRVDRVDMLRDGSVVVIDFKTGKPTRYEQKDDEGPFKGGRLLQAAVYAAAVEARHLGHVCRFEYRFPTPRGENRVVAYDPGEISAGRGLVTELLGHAGRGEFVATNDARDCAFCDYRSVCRASSGGWDNTVSPRAEWGATHGPAHEAYSSMIARRNPRGAAFAAEADE